MASMNEDLLIIERVLAEDHEAFRELVEKYQNLVYRVCLNVLSIPAQAEEISQDVFVSAFRGLPSYDGSRASFSTWLITIARNKSINAGKKLAPISMEEAPEQATRSRDQPDRMAERSEAMQALDRALGQLPPDRRRAIVLAEIEGLPHEEIALIESVAPGTIKSRVSRARQFLRAALSRPKPITKSTNSAGL
jgi:RNA polymerase sigma-70 factor (ECF subfamily)